MISVTSGPTVVSGNTNPVQNQEPDQGPSLAFQGSGLTDPRFVGQIGSAPGNKIYGLYANSYVTSTDALPVAAAAARLAAGQATTAGVAMTLVSAQGAGVSPLLPVLPLGAAPVAANLVNTLTMDFGFTVGNVVNGSKTLTIPTGAWRLFQAGQRLCIPGARGTGAAPLFTTVAVAPVPNATTLTLADAATATVNGCQVGTAHPTVDAVWPYLQAGSSITLFDPNQGICRAVNITAGGGAASNYTVRGYDIYGQFMTETIAHPGGAATANGKKAFKHIVSVTPSVTNAGQSISVGTTDIIGINFRSDFWEYMDIFSAGSFITANTGWTVADATLPATATTGDVRGTYALQTASNFDGTTANWATARRTAIFTSLPLYNVVNANNLNFATMFGNTQA